jgi:hypothetical protein
MTLASSIASANGNQLTVNGAAVTVNATGLTMPALLLDSQTNESKTFTAILLPGLHTLTDPVSGGVGGELVFTVNPNGTVSPGGAGNSYASSIASVQNGNQLIINGAAVTVNAQALTAPSLVVPQRAAAQV